MGKTTLNRRIEMLINALRHNEASFSRALDEWPRTTNRIVLGHHGASVGYIAKILVVFPSVNARWLILGEGEMFLN